MRVVRHAQSRRYRLVFDGARGELRLTVPRRASERAAIQWAAGQQAWLAEQIGKAARPVLVGPGATIPFRGIDRRIDWAPGAPRAVRLGGDALAVGGPIESVGRRIERWLKAEALALMEGESRAIAAA
ncbi:MAG: metal-dependent hydrolase, partial [Pseudomonadota bacterium]